MSHHFLQVVVGLPVEGPFDYIAKPDMKGDIIPGRRVLVPFRQRPTVAFITRELQTSEFDVLKTAMRILDEAPVLDEAMMELTRWISQYYGGSWGEAIEMAVPKLLTTKKDVEFNLVVNQKKNSKHDVVVLHDRTFEKRWPVITRLIEKVLQNQQQVIVLLPELTSLKRVHKLLCEHFEENKICCYHKTTNKNDLNNWLAIKEGSKAIVLGVRSAVFAPCPNLGLIIVDNEENENFREEQKPFYHIRDIALKRSELESCSLLFTSAAPSVELWNLVKEKKAKWMSLKAEDSARLNMIDKSNYDRDKKFLISPPLLTEMEKALEGKEKVMLYFPLVGEPLDKVVHTISRLFPSSTIVCLDKDQSKPPARFDILITTNAVFKWLGHFQVDVGAVLNIDMELSRMDFRCSHKAFALIAYLRRMAKRCLYVQTENFENQSLLAASKEDFERFYNHELKLREELSLPPFKDFVVIVARGLKEDEAQDQAQRIYDRLVDGEQEAFEVLSPQEDIKPFLRNKFRFAVIVQGDDTRKVQAFVKNRLKGMRKKKGTVITVQVNP